MAFVSAYTFVDTIAVFLLLLFSLFLWQLRTGDRTSHRLLALFLLCLALSYMDGVFLSFGYLFHYSYPYMVYLTMSFDFLVGPFLYLYVLSRTRQGFRLRPIHGLHGLVFLVHFGFLFFRYHVLSVEEKRSLLEVGQVFSREEVLALTTISNMHYAFYMLLVLSSLVAYQRTVKNLYSSLWRKNLRWLVLVCVGLLLAGLFRFSNNLLWLQIPDTSFLQYVDLKLFAVSLVLVFASTLVYKSLQEPEVLRLSEFDHSPADNGVDTDSATTPKYRTTLLAEERRKAYRDRLEQHMHEDKPYLNAELSLADLAAALSMPTHHLSQVINSEYRENFFDFVNHYRLREAARMLRDSRSDDKYITQIMYDVGFNSKSVFNTAFKREFGVTPSVFRKSTEVESLSAMSR